VAGQSTRELIEQAIRRVQSEVPALEPLKLVVGLELRGRGDVQLYRVELPGPEVKKDVAADARVRVSVPRSHFNELAADGRVRHWREAIENGHVTVTGPDQILKLVANVIARQEERARTPKAR
jgi:hypothetical protein